jgi:hypothetical protein
METKKLTAALVASATLFGSSFAEAACTQASLAGSWRVQMFNEFGFWVTCTLNVAANGAVSASKPCGSKSAVAYMVQPGGKLTMSGPGTCTFTGSFPQNSINGGRLNEIHDGVLSKNLQLGSAVGEFDTDNATFRLVRQ